MNNFPLISVILTTHRRPLYLKRALDSLNGQTFKDFEIIVCADENTKETMEVVTDSLGSHHSFIASPKTPGPAGTRNIGISIAKGKYICFLDDDDTFSKDFFEEASTLLAISDSIHYFNFTEINESCDLTMKSGISMMGKDLSKNSIDYLEIGNFIPINALFVPLNAARGTPFDIHLQSHEDWDWLIALKKQGYQFIYQAKFGPNVHRNLDASRNNHAIKSGSRALDYLSIYRKWPSTNDEIQSARSRELKNLGLNIPSNFL
jgi:glycosyltransferase involved in cell wall biosynthesis